MPSARAVSPGAHVDVPVRLWPTAEPGVYEGEWRPSVAGDYNIAVTAGPAQRDAAVTVAGDGGCADRPRTPKGWRSWPGRRAAACSARINPRRSSMD